MIPLQFVIVTEAQARAHDKFSTQYQQHVTRVYRYALIRVGNEQDAQDITSQTFLSAWQSIDTYRGKSAFSAWVFGIARHKITDFYRQKYKLQESSTLDESVRDDTPSPEETVTQQLTIEAIATQLNKLPTERADVLALRLFGNVSVKEISVILGKKEPAVRMALSRGLRDLQHRIQQSPEVSL